MRKKNRPSKRFVVCIWNEDYEADLELLKVYEQLPDADAEEDGMIRVIDETGEDYLYPARRFLSLDLSPQAQQVLETAAELQSA